MKDSFFLVHTSGAIVHGIQIWGLFLQLPAAASNYFLSDSSQLHYEPFI